MPNLKPFLVGTMLLGFAQTATAGDIGHMPPLPQPPTIPEIASIGSAWYLRGDAGYSTSNDPKMLVSRDGVADSFVSSRLGNAATLGVGIGYRVASWLRFDATLDYRLKANLKGVYTTAGDPNIAREDTSAKISAVTGLVNAYLDLGTWSGLTPYIGAGIGATSLRFGNYAGTYFISPAYGGPNPCGAVATCASPSVFPAKSRTNLAWALMAGTAIELGGGLSIDVGYRYLHLGKAETGIDPNLASLTGSAQKLRLKSVDAHEIRVGLRWELGAPLAREHEASVLGRKY